MDRETLEGMTEEEAWGMLMEEVQKIPAGLLFGAEVYTPVTGEEREALLELLGKPTGVGLPDGLVGDVGAAIPEVFAARGDHVVENRVTRRGLRMLTVTRLGARSDAGIYIEQVRAQMGGGRAVCKPPLQAETVNEATKVHRLALVWRVD